jgi:hypothetical protein
MIETSCIIDLTLAYIKKVGDQKNKKIKLTVGVEIPRADKDQSKMTR